MTASTRSTIERKRGSARAVVAIAATADEQTKAEQAALERLGANLTIPGFRPGKAPADMVREKIKEEALLEETVRQLLPVLMPLVITEHTLQPIIPPRIGIKSKSPLTVEFVIVERPAVTVAAKKINVEKKEEKLDPKEVDEVIRSILEDHRKTQEVERAAQMGDQVVIDFRGEDAEKKEIAGLQSTNETVTLGRNALIPGFEQHLAGLKKGEQKSFTVTMPADLPVETLKGKPVTFHVTMQKVEEVTLPELTDAFAKEILRVESAADARSKIEESIREREKQRESQRREQALMDQISAATDMDIPDELLMEEKRSLLEEMEQRLQRQGMTIQQWVERMGKKIEDLEKDLTKSAQDRIKLRFGLEQLLEDRKIELSDEEVKGGVEAYIRQLPPERRKDVDVSRGSPADAQIRWQKRLEKLFAELLK